MQLRLGESTTLEKIEKECWLKHDYMMITFRIHAEQKPGSWERRAAWRSYVKARDEYEDMRKLYNGFKFN